MDETRVHKNDVIAYALQKYKGIDHKKAVMIGDRSHDIMGGKANGMDTIGVLYGFGNREELEEAGADIIVETPEEILRY